MNGFGVVPCLGKFQELIELFHVAVWNFSVGKPKLFGMSKVATALTVAVFKRVNVFVQRGVTAEFRVAAVAFLFQGVID